MKMRIAVRVFMPVFSLAVLLALPGYPAQAADNRDDASAQSVAPWTSAQLDQMLAPIALYPDALLAQILMAATYPLEVVEASRWRRVPGNAGLHGNQLADVLDQQSWDPSVKSLVPFPQVLDMMDQNLDWTEQLGDAFLAQQADVMASVQHLRNDAKNAGTLGSTAQQVVSSQNQVIVIEPVSPDIVYVPVYNPMYVYGAWGYPDYPPYYFPWSGVNVGVGIGFSFGFGIVSGYWGWNQWDWDRGRIIIDARRFHRMDGNYAHAPLPPRIWQHNPEHRHGVSYHSPAVREQFHGGERGDIRGGEHGDGRGGVGGHDVPHNTPPAVPGQHRVEGVQTPGAGEWTPPAGRPVNGAGAQAPAPSRTSGHRTVPRLPAMPQSPSAPRQQSEQSPQRQQPEQHLRSVPPSPQLPRQVVPEASGPVRSQENRGNDNHAPAASGKAKARAPAERNEDRGDEGGDKGGHRQGASRAPD
ncbi:MAG: DUF3300 domain-containing protein [bacterium]|nr:DUF3300 domain-containing protein [bacterium]